jgi:hypothetical protein
VGYTGKTHHHNDNDKNSAACGVVILIDPDRI